MRLLNVTNGLTGTAEKWFENYITDRIQSVVLDSVESDIWNILICIPQGFVLTLISIHYVYITHWQCNIFHQYGITHNYIYLSILKR